MLLLAIIRSIMKICIGKTNEDQDFSRIILNPNLSMI